MIICYYNINKNIMNCEEIILSVIVVLLLIIILNYFKCKNDDKLSENFSSNFTLADTPVEIKTVINYKDTIEGDKLAVKNSKSAIKRFKKDLTIPPWKELVEPYDLTENYVGHYLNKKSSQNEKFKKNKVLKNLTNSRYLIV